MEVSDDTPLNYDVEFLSPADDAWYSVCTLLRGENLSIKYFNFPNEEDTVIVPAQFQSLKHLEEFRERFRQASPQLQDDECENVKRGTVVCASHSFDGLGNCFYDAVVDDVIHREHSFAKGEECLCTFIVVWRHGPGYGCLANKSIENICLVASEIKLNEPVARFLKITARKLKKAMNDVVIALPAQDCASGQRLNQGEKRISFSPMESLLHKGKIGNEKVLDREDNDVGGLEKKYVVLIENLENDMAPSTITEFIHRQTSLSVEAFILPSTLSCNTYTKGVIVLDSVKKLEKLREFLYFSNRIIMSEKGRPWVITETVCELDVHNFCKMAIAIFNYQNLKGKTAEVSKKLKVVYAGSDEYKIAKQLQDLFIEFVEHQKGLHERLAMEEKEILRQLSLVL